MVSGAAEPAPQGTEMPNSLFGGLLAGSPMVSSKPARWTRNLRLVQFGSGSSGHSSRRPLSDRPECGAASIVAGLLTAALSVSSAQKSAALIFGPDNRRFVDTRAGSPFSPVGILFKTGDGYATAFLVDDCHVLTVQHVFGNALRRRAEAQCLRYEWARTAGSRPGASSSTTEASKQLPAYGTMTGLSSACRNAWGKLKDM